MVLLAPAIVVGSPAAQAAALPPNFQDRVVLSGLTNPIGIEFAAAGRVFVAQTNGVTRVSTT